MLRKVLVQVVEPLHAVEVVLEVPRLLPVEGSYNCTLSKNAAADAALPLKVTTTVLITAAPAESAAKVNVPRSSTADLARPVDAPNAPPVTVSFVRSTVMVFAVGAEEPVAKVTADVAFEVLPKATTVSPARVSLSLSVELAILNTWVVLSVAPDEAYVETSPFKTKVIEFD